MMDAKPTSISCIVHLHQLRIMNWARFVYTFLHQYIVVTSCMKQGLSKFCASEVEKLYTLFELNEVQVFFSAARTTLDKSTESRIRVELYHFTVSVSLQFACTQHHGIPSTNGIRVQQVRTLAVLLHS